MKLRIILMCIMLSLMAVPAFAVGTVSGTVTDANSQPLAGITVQFYNPVTGNTITRAGITDSTGNYSVGNLNAGSYRVIFFGNNATPAPYVQKWYNGADSFATATNVTVANNLTTSGINAVMGGVAQPKIDLGSVSNGAPGTVVKIPVTLTTGGAAISSPGLTITYDPAKVVSVTSFDPADLAQTPALGPAAVAAGKTISDSSPAAGTYTIGLLSTSNTNVIGDGVIVNLFFELAADATGPITLASVPSAADPSGAPVAVTGTSGTISFPDLTKPVVTAFTVPATSSSTVVSVTSFTATDNVAVTGYLITESSIAPAASDSAWATTTRTSYIAGSDGVKTLFAWAKDAAGNVSLSQSATVTITIPDTTKPLVSFTMPATATSLTVPVTTLTATDNVGVTGYQLNETAAAPAPSAGVWSATAPTSFTFSAGGTRTVYAWAKDAAGNVSTVKPAVVTITLPDGIAPTVSAFTVPATSTSLTVPVSSFTATDNLAVTGYKVTESATAPAASDVWSTTAPVSYAVAGTIPQGVATSVTLFAWAKDAVGNISASVSAAVELTIPDTTKPVVSAFSIPATATSATVSVSSLTATDNLAVTGYLLTESATAPAVSDTGWTSTAPTSYSFTGLPQGASNKTLFAWAKDAAGNVSDSQSAAVTITLTGPSLSFSATTLASGTATKNPALNIVGNVSGAGTVTLTLAHNGATAVPVTFDTTTGDFTTAVVLVTGDNTLVTVATDTNGTTTDTRTITLNPELADLTVTSPSNSSFTKNSFVDVIGTVGAPQSTTVTIKLNDEAVQAVALNGEDFTVPLNLVAGPNTIVITATDTVTGAHTLTIGITSDGSAPTLAVTSPSDAFATPKASVVVSGTVSDAVTTPTLSVTVDGVALETQPVITEGAFSFTLALPSVKTYAVVVTATDQSGNSATITRNIIKKDPSGNATNGVSTPTIADVQKALQFALGLAAPTADELIYMDVAPLANGKPSPDGAMDGGDALVILEKVVGTVTW